jgi:hypothetical protein
VAAAYTVPFTFTPRPELERPAIVRAPAAEILVVPVCPAAKVLKSVFLEKKVVEVALVSVTLPTKVLMPVHELVSVRSVDEAELPDAPTHTPLIEKQPAARLKPLAAVEVAAVPVRLRYVP